MPESVRRLRAGLLSAVAVVALGASAMTAVATPAPVPPAASAQAAPGFADVVARVMPAVVNISTTRAAEQIDFEASPHAPPGSPFEEMLRRFFEMQRGSPGAETHALGSGFIVDPAGYVVTNNHVIDGANEIVVILQDGSKLPAKLVGSDDKTDLALLKVEAEEPLPAVAFGDSDAARVGDWVVAVGNPFGLGGTVTAGIVSARGRDLNAGPFDDFLQIDAPINPGNSGGPTFNAAGEVIGVNTAISTPNGGSVGIGFAVPSELARQVVAELREHGHVERSWLGVSIQQVTPELARALNLDKPRGALVADVSEDSPAAKAGLKHGDVIVAFDGEAVDTAHDLPRLVAGAEAGEPLAIGVWRDGKTVELETKLAAAAPSRSADAKQPSAEDHGLGLALSSITPPTRRQLGISEEVKGVLVTGVKPGGAAAETGIRPGDVIEQVGRKPVATPGEVADAVRDAKGEKQSAVLVLVNRGGQERFVALPLA
jgi:serine protease Do